MMQNHVPRFSTNKTTAKLEKYITYIVVSKLKIIVEMYFSVHLAWYWRACTVVLCICGCCVEKRWEYGVVQKFNSADTAS